MTPAVTRASKWLAGLAGILTGLSAIAGAATWAADTRYVQIVVFENSQTDFEKRQLKRDIKRLELKDLNGSASAEDRAFLEFLRQELEELKAP